MESASDGNDSARIENELTQLYWNVSRCWNSEELAIKAGMTTEMAIQLLVKVREGAKSKDLRKKAERLLNDIIYLQDDLPEDDPVLVFDQCDINRGKEATSGNSSQSGEGLLQPSTSA